MAEADETVVPNVSIIEGQIASFISLEHSCILLHCGSAGMNLGKRES